MSNYTEADVEQARVRVRALIRGQVVSLNEQASLETLIAAALEGAKVPGLVERNVANLQTIGELQARVAELDAKVEARDEQAFGLRQSLDGATKRVAVLASERDALRALVARIASTLRKADQHLSPDNEPDAVVLWAGNEYEREPVATYADLRRALSVPPAETTPRAAPISDPEWARKAAALEDGCDVVVGPPTETTPGIDPMSGACSTCGAIHAPGMNTLCSAERTPAPERAEAKRSCKWHRDCEAADQAAGNWGYSALHE